ncbi:lipase 3-like [Galendromus occidentalis]|uniref:Lipase 3-like n=1 Tax=Galendromus occidentalis TaxID=34638 RepID=A0AAJ7WI00_9ACAR|nr:lipase 3-like [Galendromus occidentalis]
MYLWDAFKSYKSFLRLLAGSNACAIVPAATVTGAAAAFVNCKTCRIPKALMLAGIRLELNRGGTNTNRHPVNTKVRIPAGMACTLFVAYFCVGVMRLPLFALLIFVPMSAASQDVFDYLFRSASDLGKSITDPFFELARGILQKTEPILITDPDAIAANKGVDYYIRYKGYPVETHKIRTKDNVTLTLHRIRGAPGSIPVLLQHGVMSSSFDFVANLRSQSLGFILYDEGYDVWMLNSRGNKYSSESGRTKKHFYEFTWDELAAYDMPDSIDYVLATTGHRKLHVVGHSRGTTIMIAMLASKPEYNQKIRLAVLLSPVVFLTGVSAFVQNLITVFSNPAVRYAIDVWTENRPLFTNSRADLAYFTSNPSLCSARLCPFANDLSGILLSNNGNHNQSRLAVYSTHFPAGTSFNDLKHYMQMYHSKRFAYFDYGSTARNLHAYGSVRPPSYDLSKVTAKMLIFYSKDDAFISVEDGARVSQLFKNNIYKNTAILLPCSGFVHMDFLWSVNAKKQLYNMVIKRMHEYDEEHRRR